MTETERLRAQAERCLRLAKGAEGSAIGDAMRELAGEYLSRSNSEIDRDYPHQVEIEIPDGGLGREYAAMGAFCIARGCPYGTRGIGGLRFKRGRDGMRWCFTDPAHANEFHKEFGGQRLMA
jgi:hypothetical protein